MHVGGHGLGEAKNGRFGLLFPERDPNLAFFFQAKAESKMLTVGPAS